MVRMLISLSVVMLVTFSARAEILFEGYSKVMSGGVHIGYSIARYEFDPKKKQFIATTFVKTGELGGNLNESVVAQATDDFKPIAYHYATLIGTQTKTIDAKFEKNKMVASVVNGGKSEKIVLDLPKGAFLSTFLAYVMLKSKEGLKVNTKYDYQAIAEEDAALYKGLAFIGNPETFNGMKALRVVNDFKNSKFISLINERGEVYSTKSPAQSITTELVAQPSQATGSFPMPSAVLKKLYGDIPTGQINEVSKASQAAKAPTGTLPTTDSTPAPEATLIPGKQIGVPPGKGIQIKTQPPSGGGQ